ncbi:MFS transporter [Streptomyces sp. NBC_00932]|uniref:MFS transporter n=1 Tax=Streptomyces sp. NBC_00932 TaxID=2903690 RepID=UPI0038643453|nr:MFS transporter [Streptomyces sp. NBC_00932]
MALPSDPSRTTADPTAQSPAGAASGPPASSAAGAASGPPAGSAAESAAGPVAAAAAVSGAVGVPASGAVGSGTIPAPTRSDSGAGSETGTGAGSGTGPTPGPPAAPPGAAPLPSLWRDRRFVLLASARTISVLGNGFARVALAFAVLSLPGATPGRLSLVLACQALPQLVLILVGGVIADRMSRSRLMMISDCLGAAAYGGLAAMVLTGHAPLTAMCLLAVVAGTASALFAPAMSGVVPQIVPAAQFQQANALLRVGMNGSMVLGLALSGVTVATFGAGWALALNAASFVVSAGLIRGLRLTTAVRAASSGWADLRDGWKEFISRQWLWAVVCQAAVMVAAVASTSGVLGPLEAKEHLGGAGAWSAIVAAQAVGTVAGASFAVRIRVRRPLLVAVVAIFPVAVPMALLAAHAPVWVICLAMFCSGLSTDVFGALWETTMQREIPEAVLSRVSSYDWFGSLALAPLGLLVAGPIAAAVGTRAALAGCAGATVLATFGALLSPQVRTLRAPVEDG